MTRKVSTSNDVRQFKVWQVPLPRFLIGGLVLAGALGAAGLGVASMAWAGIAEAIGPVSLSFEERVQVILPPRDQGYLDDVLAVDFPTAANLADAGIPKQYGQAIEIAYDKLAPDIPQVIPGVPATRGILGVFGVVALTVGVLGLLPAGALLLSRRTADD